MRVPRFRLTIRRMMVVVAIVGIAFGAIMERKARFLRIAARHAAWRPPIVPSSRGSSASRRGIWSIRMQNKYERAARYPWLPVEPDPPGPE